MYWCLNVYVCCFRIETKDFSPSLLAVSFQKMCAYFRSVFITILYVIFILFLFLSRPRHGVYQKDIILHPSGFNPRAHQAPSQIIDFPSGIHIYIYSSSPRILSTYLYSTRSVPTLWALFFLLLFFFKETRRSAI